MTFSDVLIPDMLKIFEAVPDLYLILSPDLRILTASNAYLTATHLDGQEIAGKNILDPFPGNFYTENIQATEQLRSSLQKVISTGKPDQITLHSRHLFITSYAGNHTANKSWEVSHTPVLSSKGHLQYIIHKIIEKPGQENQPQDHDPETVQAYAELERNKLYHLLMQAPAMICIFEGPQHIFRLANPPYQQLVGDRPILGKPIAEAMPELAGQPIFALLDQVYQTGESFYAHEMKVQLDHTNSGQLGNNYYNFIYQPTRDLSGNIDGILVFAYEVTVQVLARKKAEQGEKQLQFLNKELATINGELVRAKHELEQLNHDLEARVEARTRELGLAHLEVDRQKNRLERLFMEAPAAICILNGPDLVYELVNPGYQQLFPDRQLLGKPILEALPEITDNIVYTLFRQVYETGITQQEQNLLIPFIHPGTGELEDRYFKFIIQARYNEFAQIDGVLVFAFEVTIQTKALLKTEESEKQLRLITDALPVLIGYLDKEEKYRFTNQAYQAWFNQPAESLLGRPVREIVGEKAYQGVKKYIDRALAGERLDFEARMPYRDNFVKHIYTSYVPHIQQGEVVGFYTLVTDITEQIESLQKVEESEKRFRTLLESIPQITWTALPNGYVDYFSQQWYDYSHHTYEQSKGEGWANVIYPEDRPNLLSLWKQSVQTGALYQVEARIKRGDGMYRWFLIRGLPLINQQGEIYQWIGTCTDLEDKKQWEQQLLESEQYFRMMADNVPVMIWVTRPDGYCTYLNKPWYEYTGQTEEEAAGLGWTKATHPEDAENASKIFMEASTNQTIFRLNYRLRGKDGSYRWFTDVGLPRFSETGEFEGHVGAVLDIDEQKMAETSLQQSTQELAAINEELAAANEEIQTSNEELSQSNQQLTYINADLDNFIYTASHDLKAPIVNIEGLMKVLVRHLSKEIQEDKSTQKTIGYIQDSIERFKRTIASLTEVVKLQKENNQPVAWVDVAMVLEEVKLDLDAEIKTVNARIEADVSQCPVIRFSEKNLRSVLYNLVSNALKYHAPERPLEIHIHCTQSDGYQVLTVADNGLGMNLSGEQKLFSMFRRLHSHVEGSGIGLYMVKRIVENAGGKIEVESSVGLGSSFRVYFKHERD